MAVMIIKNNTVVKTFKKYFTAFALNEMEKWTNEHFHGAKEKRIDRGSKTIYIIY